MGRFEFARNVRNRNTVATIALQKVKHKLHFNLKLTLSTERWLVWRRLLPLGMHGGTWRGSPARNLFLLAEQTGLFYLLGD